MVTLKCDYIRRQGLKGVITFKLEPLGWTYSSMTGVLNGLIN